MIRTDKPHPRLLGSLLVATGLALSAPAQAELRESQVLVVYDSRVPDSLAVAEYYAGSQKVPGGSGTRPGSRTGVRVVNLADLPGAGFGTTFPVPNITYTDFVTKLRDPLKNYINSNNLAAAVRCIVLTKGLPHRIQDTDNPNPNVGDQPNSAVAELNAGDLTYASVDSELTLLQVNLIANEAGGTGDSKADGCISNPYFKSTQPISAYSTTNINVTKNIRVWGGNTGIFWFTFQSSITDLTPGDIYLVCRLDGNSVADVMGEIDRGREVKIDLDQAVLVIDESGSNGVQNVSDSDFEFDNDGPTLTNNGDDYEQTRDLLISDGRFLPANVRYEAIQTSNNFLVGPLIDFGGGIVVNGPVQLLATYGANHAGAPGTPGNAGTQYPFSFRYMPGAIFNTIESFNGRSFGGIGIGFTPQGQLADFIQAGGTFGIGNVWEPLSFSVPDNVILTRNFLLGSLTWAEAAYTAMPVLSWQELVIGDPLAKVRRTKEDINGDGRNDLEDLYAWFAPASRPRDLNRSGGAPDRTDVELLRDSLRGPESGNMRVRIR